MWLGRGMGSQPLFCQLDGERWLGVCVCGSWGPKNCIQLSEDEQGLPVFYGQRLGELSV